MNKKIRKIISKILISNILFVNFPINSLASTLSDNSRYETFEGSNIKIDNILEEDKVDIEVEGNTLVNVLDYSLMSSLSNTPNNLGISIDGKEITRNYDATSGIEGSWSSNEILIRKDVVYTFVVDIIKNTTTDKVELFPFMWRYGTQKKGSEYVSPGYTGKVIVSFASNTDSKLYLLHENSARDISGSMTISNLMLLRGDYYNEFTARNTNIPNYFEGIKSVSEDEGYIDIYSSNSITENSSYIKGYGLSSGNTALYKNDKRNVLDYTVVEPNTHYKFNHTAVYVLNFYNNNKEYLGFVNPSFSFTTPANCYYIKASIDINYGEKVNIVKSDKDFKESNLEIKLQEPLRSLPNGTRDRIIKKNGQWFVERNVGEIIIDETQQITNGSAFNSDEYITYVVYTNVKNNTDINSIHCVSDRYLSNVRTSQNIVPKFEFITNTTTKGKFGIAALKSKYPTLEDFKNGLKNDNITLLYTLEKPIYEPLKISPSLFLYNGTNYIAGKSVIFANVKVTVDRVANRAQEAMEVAKTSPTIENLSIARMWINLMRESTLKDDFQEEINNIIQIDDLEVERKKASTNLDLYVKSENMLSMSLSTNSVTFENYSGVEDLEILNAVSINVNSSLPYDLNAYLTDEIYNRDKSKSIDVKTLNIREGTKPNYNQFNSVAEKLVLKDNCEAANGTVHNIDLKLSNDDSHNADIYKTVIKFEVEQK